MRWIHQAAYLLACSILGTKLLPLAWLSRFGISVCNPMSNGAPWEVDGRKAHQWIASVQAYLEWRAGDSWRPVSQRFHPEREYYVCGYRTLMQAWLGPEPAAKRLPQPIPFPAKPAYKPKRRAA